MGRPKREPTVHVRVKRSLMNGLREEFPSISSDGDRVATCFYYYKNVQGTVDKVGGFLYGKKNWKKAYKK